MSDWGLGSYEPTAAELAPVAERSVALADPQQGERVLDLATGTGNAALCAARAGAEVTGVDTASRLIDVARRRAALANLDAAFLVADVQSLPFADCSFDVVLSVFGLIFAADAELAFAEMVRVLAADGRAVVSVWIPAGPIDAMVGVFARAMAGAGGSRPPRFSWHDLDAVRALARAHGAELDHRDAELEIVADSPEAYLERNQEHPMSVAGRPLLERAGTLQATTAEALAVLRDANQSPSGFRVRSPYRLIEVRRRASVT